MMMVMRPTADEDEGMPNLSLTTDLLRVVAVDESGTNPSMLVLILDLDGTYAHAVLNPKDFNASVVKPGSPYLDEFPRIHWYNWKHRKSAKWPRRFGRIKHQADPRPWLFRVLGIGERKALRL